MKTKTSRALIVVLMLTVVATGGYYMLGRTNRNLAQLGRRVARLSPPTAQAQSFVIGSVPGGKLLTCRYDLSTGTQDYNVIDVESGAVSMLPQIDAALKKEINPLPAYLSPDGQWLGYNRLAKGDVQYLYAIIRTDGSKVIRFNFGKAWTPSQTIWSADSQGGVAVNYETGQVSRWNLNDPSLPSHLQSSKAIR